ncbi:MAG: bifunctional demethylmenaquinone methyltransferase/2-methoxy-6-polyprenyl-1,4-benzoquinol methylase UbiE [Cyanobacteria bacterium]|nr:bifunctional demethylmenaquinone methyltransferase/2-methoxy-6-polyprenyl-1,4-benzoquinol methylase UbiE [Cyanobacteriota bacterium]
MIPGDEEAVRDLFEAVAPRYDLLNDLLSLGGHRLWKRQAVAWLNPRPGQRLLDLCCGTGDGALLLAQKVRPGGQVLGLDAAAAPLQRARHRAAQEPWLPLRFDQGDALATGLEAGWADGALMAYGLRNLVDPARGLAELRRVVRVGGRAAVLDFKRPDPAGGPSQGWAAQFQHFYLNRVVVPVASLVDLKEQYAYLETSLARFPTAQQQIELARQAGFAEVGYRPLAAGLMGFLTLVA